MEDLNHILAALAVMVDIIWKSLENKSDSLIQNANTWKIAEMWQLPLFDSDLLSRRGV